MPKKPETLFQEKVLQDLKKLPRTFFFKKQAGSIRGLPDLVLCVSGVFVALELKVDDNKPDPLQNHRLRAINTAGGYARAVWPETWPTILQHLKTITRELP